MPIPIRLPEPDPVAGGRSAPSSGLIAGARITHEPPQRAKFGG